MAWSVDLSTLTATHESGLRVHFKHRACGWDGEGVRPFPRSLPLDASLLARMMNEAAEAFIEAIKASAAKYRCLRCAHFWNPKKPGAPTPRICPSCKSPYWDKPRRQ